MSGEITSGEAAKSPGLLLVMTAPSGTGKSTITQRLLQAEPAMRLSVSATTRTPRPGEIDGVHYHFVTPDEFARMVAAGELLEHAHVHGRDYGTPAAPVREALDQGAVILLDIDVQGAFQVRAWAQADPARPQPFLLFIEPPSFAELERRLRGRGTETEAQLQLRLTNARHELSQAGAFDARVVNDELERATAEIRAVVAAERARRVNAAGSQA